MAVAAIAVRGDVDDVHDMIGRIRHRGLKRLYERGDASRLPADMVDRIEQILSLLDTVASVEAMDIPGFRLHPLKGDLRGYWSVTVRANWRIIFRVEDGMMTDVDFLDYH
jgi:proteic killer suppression protein